MSTGEHRDRTALDDSGGCCVCAGGAEVWADLAACFGEHFLCLEPPRGLFNRPLISWSHYTWTSKTGGWPSPERLRGVSPGVFSAENAGQLGTQARGPMPLYMCRSRAPLELCVMAPELGDRCGPSCCFVFDDLVYAPPAGQSRAARAENVPTTIGDTRTEPAISCTRQAAPSDLRQAGAGRLGAT